VALTIRSDQGASFEHYARAAKMCIDFTLRMDALPLLFAQLYQPFGKIKLARAAFFGELEPLVRAAARHRSSPSSLAVCRCGDVFFSFCS
jgi:hypothetical protein